MLFNARERGHAVDGRPRKPAVRTWFAAVRSLSSGRPKEMAQLQPALKSGEVRGPIDGPLQKDRVESVNIKLTRLKRKIELQLSLFVTPKSDPGQSNDNG